MMKTHLISAFYPSVTRSAALGATALLTALSALTAAPGRAQSVPSASLAAFAKTSPTPQGETAREANRPAAPFAAPASRPAPRTTPDYNPAFPAGLPAAGLPGVAAGAGQWTQKTALPIPRTEMMTAVVEAKGKIYVMVAITSGKAGLTATLTRPTTLEPTPGRRSRPCPRGPTTWRPSTWRARFT